MVEVAGDIDLENIDEADVSLVDNSIEPAVEEDLDAGTNLTFPATIPGDGSEEDADGIPSRFLLMKKSDREGAKEAWEAHLAWRDEFEVGSILSRPHAKYDVCKAMVPHYFAGRDPHGNIVFVQRPAMLDFDLARINNATMDDLLLHYIYIIEYCWNILDPELGKIMTNVLDMTGMSLRNLKNQEYIYFGKKFVSMMSSNYPGRSYKTLIVNAPKWFHMLYRLFKPVLRESTRQKIVIFKAGPQQDAALKFYLGDAIPKDLLSESEDNDKEKGSDSDASGENGTEGGEKSEKTSRRYFLPVDEEEQCEPGPNSLFEFHMRQFFLNQLNSTDDDSLQEIL